MRINRQIKLKSIEERTQVVDFFKRLDTVLVMGNQQNHEMITDYVHAFAYFQRKGLSIDEIIKRLDPSRLGNVYAVDSDKWFKLDTAAIVYPLGMGHGSMGMFRLSYYLKKHVSAQVLQIALNNTIKRFPTFGSSVRRGFFWHYLDTSINHFKVHLDNSVPCTTINLSYSKSQIFKVYHYENRISIDFFHVATDGTGGLVFLNTLVAEYLRLQGEEVTYSHNVLDIEDKPTEHETKEAFYEIEDINNKSSFVEKMPRQLRGKRSRTHKRVLHFTIPTNELVSLAKSKQTTITTLMLTYMFLSAKQTSKKEDSTYSIQVPINMRKYYPSETLRNFSLYMNIRRDNAQINDSKDFYDNLSETLKEKGSKLEMAKMATMSKDLINALNYIPLFLKSPVMRVAYPILSERVISSVLSNLGTIDIPESLKKHIDKADFVLGVQEINRAVCSMISINNKTVFSISKITRDSSFEDTFYQHLVDAGLSVEVTGGENFGI